MKKTILILLAFLVLAVSCSQVVYDNLPPVDIGGASTAINARQQDETSRNLVLTFAPVPYVSAYAYSFNDGTPIPFEADKYENGMLSYSIYAAKVPSNEGTVNLFGRTSGSTSWVKLGESAYEIKIEGEIPDAYVYERHENKVVLNINPASNGKEYLYRLVVMTEDEEILYDTKDFVQAENGSITIETPKEKCLINVYQRESLDVPAEEAYASIEVYEFSNTVGLDLTVDDAGFHVSGIASDTTEVALKNRDNTSLNIVLKGIDAGNGGIIDIPFKDVPSLESGLFYVYSTNGSVVSNNVKTTAPVSILSTTPNYRSVDLEINFSSLVDVSNIDFSANDSIGTYNVDVVSVDSDNKTKVSVTELDSNTTYNTDQIALVINDVDIAISEFTTKSFAGKFFKWEGTFSNGTDKSAQNFIIYVDNAPVESDYPYYIYFAKNDKTINLSQNYEKSDYRLMPLIDNSEDLGDNADPQIEGFINWDNSLDNAGKSFEKQNETYKQNSKKWNTFSLVHPSKWNVTNVEINGDKVQVITNSEAMFVGIVETDSRFEFCESSSGKPYISFYNNSDDITAANFIAKRGTTEFPIFDDEPSNLNTFWLGLVENAEGDVE